MCENIGGWNSYMYNSILNVMNGININKIHATNIYLKYIRCALIPPLAKLKKIIRKPRYNLHIVYSVLFLGAFKTDNAQIFMTPERTSSPSSNINSDWDLNC